MFAIYFVESSDCFTLESLTMGTIESFYVNTFIRALFDEECLFSIFNLYAKQTRPFVYNSNCSFVTENFFFRFFFKTTTECINLIIISGLRVQQKIELIFVKLFLQPELICEIILQFRLFLEFRWKVFGNREIFSPECSKRVKGFFEVFFWRFS